MAAVSDSTRQIEQEQSRRYSEVAKGFTPFRNGDVIVAKITPCFENGKMALVNLNYELSFGSTEFHVIRSNPDVLDRRYLYHFLGQDAIRHKGESRMTGSAGQRRVPKAFYEQLEIPLPPLPEQHRIAAILDAADALRAKRRAALAKLDALGQAVFLEMFGEPVSNTKGWPMGRIGDLAVQVNYGTSKKAGNTGQFPILRMGNITYDGGWDLSDLKYIDLDEREATKHLAYQGDVLFNRTNSRELVGKTAVFREPEPMAFAGYLVRLITNERADPEYIAAFMNTHQVKALLREKSKSIIGMANINASEFQAIRIPVPPVQLQHQYAKVVEAIQGERKTCVQSGQHLEQLFQTIQQQAFHGELP